MENIRIGKLETKRLMHVGQFSNIYEVEGLNKDGLESVVKFKMFKEGEEFVHDLFLEVKIFQLMRGNRHIPRLLSQKVDKQSSYIQMERLGASLTDLKLMCGNSFSLKTTLLLFDQMLEVVSDFHKVGVVIGELKPNHFLIGCGLNSDTLYLIDYENYQLKGKGATRSIDSVTYDFLPTDSLMGKGPSKAGDVESLFYILLFMILETMPWSSTIAQGINETSSPHEVRMAYFREKKYMPPELVCFGLPGRFIRRVPTTLGLRETTESQRGPRH